MFRFHEFDFQLVLYSIAGVPKRIFSGNPRIGMVSHLQDTT